MTDRTEKLLMRMESLKLSVKFSVIDFAKGFRVAGYEFCGSDENLMVKARNYICLHDDILSDLAAMSGYKYDPAKARGNLATAHEHEVWRAVIAPVGEYEQHVSTYWHNWRFFYHLEGRSPDFYTMWLNETKGKDRLTYWLSETHEGFNEFMADFRAAGSGDTSSLKKA